LLEIRVVALDGRIEGDDELFAVESVQPLPALALLELFFAVFLLTLIE